MFKLHANFEMIVVEVNEGKRAKNRRVSAMLAEVRWRPDPIFMLDICESGGRLWLVELNSFSSSWLYQCDLGRIVAEASELASRAWTESHG